MSRQGAWWNPPHRRRWLSAVLAAALFSGSGASSFAQSTVATGATAARVEEELKRGQALIVERKLTEAAGAFEQAYKDLGATIFLYNAAVSAEMAQDLVRATSRYEDFLTKEPNDPGAATIRAHVASLKSAVGAAPAQLATAASIRSIVKIDSDPTGAPVSVYERTDPAAAPFSGGDAPAGWVKVGDKPFSTPSVFSLKVGHYRVLIEPFRDYKGSATDIDVAPGYVHELRASLSQGSFLAFLRVTSPVEGAKIYLDRPPSPAAAVWGRTPKSDFVEDGDHDVWVEATGFQPFQKRVHVEHGQAVDVRAELSRVPYGVVRLDSKDVSYFDIALAGERPAKYDWHHGPYEVKLQAGLHRLVLKADGKKDYLGTVDVPPGQVIDVHARFSDSMSYAPTIVTGILAAGCGVGAALAGLHSGEVLNADKDKSLFQNLMIVGIVGAGVFAATSIFFAIDFGPDSSISTDKPREFDSDDRSKDAKKPALTGVISPYFGPGAGGVSLGAVF